jgi:hypothetical protein
MPLPEDATLFIRIWTGQTCGACGSEFRYVRRYKVLRSQTEFNATQASVESDYVQGCRKTSEVVAPCPHCGFIQLDMVGTRKAVRHGVFTFVVFLLLLVNTFTAAFGLVAPEIAASVAAGLAAIALVFHLYQAVADLNRDRLASLAKAQLLVQKGMLQLLKIGEGAFPPNIRRPLSGYLGASSILLASFAMLAAPAVADVPFWLCEVGGIVLFIWSGSRFANLALDIKQYANPVTIVEVNTTLTTDDQVPEDFQKK